MAGSEIQRGGRPVDPVGSSGLNSRVRIAILSFAAFSVAGTILLSACGTSVAATLPRLGGPYAVQATNQAGRTRAGAMRSGHPRMHEHLPEWIRQHGNLPLAEQEQALRAQPGFDRLPTRRQQRLIHRLEQLDAMPPQQRERTLQRMEAMEKLSRDQRRQVRHTMRDILQMPPEERQKMHQAFQRLAQLPPDQRQTTLDSQQFKNEFSDRQRQMLRTLMSVQPYVPTAQPAGR